MIYRFGITFLSHTSSSPHMSATPLSLLLNVSPHDKKHSHTFIFLYLPTAISTYFYTQNLSLCHVARNNLNHRVTKTSLYTSYIPATRRHHVCGCFKQITLHLIFNKHHQFWKLNVKSETDVFSTWNAYCVVLSVLYIKNWFAAGVDAGAFLIYKRPPHIPRSLRGTPVTGAQFLLVSVRGEKSGA